MKPGSLSTVSPSPLLTFDPLGHEEPQLVTLPRDRFDPDPHQPRREVGDVTDLALLHPEPWIAEPIPVERQPKGRYRILGGERRFTVC